MEARKENNMEYRYLGRTGVKVSALSYGNFVNSKDEGSQKLTTDCIRKCLEYGVNFFDTAEGYAHGAAETLMGNAFKEIGVKREDIVISTKIYFMGILVPGASPNSVGLSRKHIIEGTKNSIKRLQCDYVDVIYAHRPDFQTPLEETCRAFSWLIDQGLAFYWGTSEWSAARLSQAIELCKHLNLHAPIVEQPEYNMINRENFEEKMRPLYEQYGLGTTCWGPLAGGILTGKYNSGVVPEDTRMANDPISKNFTLPRFFGPTKKDETLRLLNAIGDIAKEIGCTQVQLALAWNLANKDVSTLLLGFSRVEQIDENMKALDVYKKWTKEIEAKCEAALKNAPTTEIDCKELIPLEPRRKVALKADAKQ